MIGAEEILPEADGETKRADREDEKSGKYKSYSFYCINIEKIV